MQWQYCTRTTLLIGVELNFKANSYLSKSPEIWDKPFGKNIKLVVELITQTIVSTIRKSFISKTEWKNMHNSYKYPLQLRWNKPNSISSEISVFRIFFYYSITNLSCNNVYMCKLCTTQATGAQRDSRTFWLFHTDFHQRFISKHYNCWLGRGKTGYKFKSAYIRMISYTFQNFSGTLSKQGHVPLFGWRLWHKRWFQLEHGTLHYFENKQAAELGMEPLGSFNLESDSHVSIVDNSIIDRNFCFQVMTNKQTVVMQASGEDERNCWMQASIWTVINMAYKNSFCNDT